MALHYRKHSRFIKGTINSYREVRILRISSETGAMPIERYNVCAGQLTGDARIENENNCENMMIMQCVRTRLFAMQIGNSVDECNG